MLYAQRAKSKNKLYRAKSKVYALCSIEFMLYRAKNLCLCSQSIDISSFGGLKNIVDRVHTHTIYIFIHYARNINFHFNFFTFKICGGLHLPLVPLVHTYMSTHTIVYNYLKKTIPILKWFTFRLLIAVFVNFMFWRSSADYCLRCFKWKISYAFWLRTVFKSTHVLCPQSKCHCSYNYTGHFNPPLSPSLYIFHFALHLHPYKQSTSSARLSYIAHLKINSILFSSFLTLNEMNKKWFCKWMKK